MLKRLGWVSVAVLMLAGVGCEQPRSTAVAPTDAATGAVQSDDATRSTSPPAEATAAGSLSPAIAQPAAAISPAVIEEGGVDANGEIVLSAPVAEKTAEVSDREDAASQVASSLPLEPARAQASAVTVLPTAASSPAPANLQAKSTPADNRGAANVVQDFELNQKIAEDWPQPQAVLFLSGQQHGYLEPCGCTGLDRQKGGLIRRDTLLTSLRERGWEVIPVDAGNQVRRLGRQAELKFKATADAFKTMGYVAATLGVDDLKLSSVELLQIVGSDASTQTPFISANVSVLDPSYMPASRVVEAGGRKIGITGFLGEEYRPEIRNDDIELFEPVEKLKPAIEELKGAGCDFIVLLAHASLEESASVARQLDGIDLVVTAGGFGEPTLAPEPIEGSSAVMVQVGVKGMHGGIVGLFDDAENPIRYQRIAISAQFKDSVRMLEDFAKYQIQLKQAGFDALGATSKEHESGRKFVGSQTCGDCHTTAFEIWENSPHVHATESIVHPPNDRGGIERHFDPECVSCHVTGWDPQKFQPYESGYLSLDASELLLGSGCENCHGPGSQHVAAEQGDIEADNELLEKLRQEMVLPLARARDKCLECHDLDNSPDFHVEGAFEEYWEQVKHYGKD